jgi:uncharacterized protein (TIGR02598 family)
MMFAMRFTAPSTLPFLNFRRRPLPGARRRAFSLVEVALAVGVVSFSMLAVVGSVPVGLQSVHDSMVDTAKANITNHLRGEMQQISFSTAASATTTNVDGLANKTYFYTQEGMFQEADTTGATPPADAYYAATFAVNQIGTGPQGSADPDTETYIPVVDASFQSGNARSITVTLKFPQGVGVQQQTAKFSLLSAMQKNR